MPQMEGFPWADISVKFCMEIKGWQNGEEITPKVSTPEYGTRTLQTTDGFAIANTRTSRSHVQVRSSDVVLDLGCP